jgi:hypothetical protein
MPGATPAAIFTERNGCRAAAILADIGHASKAALCENLYLAGWGIGERITDVRFLPESRHRPPRLRRPLSANSGH